MALFVAGRGQRERLNPGLLFASMLTCLGVNADDITPSSVFFLPAQDINMYSIIE
jgi:hypothetical protein